MSQVRLALLLAFQEMAGEQSMLRKVAMAEPVLFEELKKKKALRRILDMSAPWIAAGDIQKTYQNSGQDSEKIDTER